MEIACASKPLSVIYMKDTSKRFFGAKAFICFPAHPLILMYLPYIIMFSADIKKVPCFQKGTFTND